MFEPGLTETTQNKTFVTTTKLKNVNVQKSYPDD